MDIEQVRTVVEEVLRNRTMLAPTLVSIAMSAIFAGLGAYIGSYLQYKAKKEIDRQERTLDERRKLVETINKNLEIVKNAFHTLRKTGKMPRDVPVVNHETLLLTVIDMDLQLHQAILTEKFHQPLKTKYELVRHIWDGQKPWEPFIKEWDDLNKIIQEEMKITFKLSYS